MQLAGMLNVASESEGLAPLIMPPWMFGAVILAALLLLMFITVSFTNVGNRHEPVEEAADPHRQHPNKHDHGSACASSDH